MHYFRGLLLGGLAILAVTIASCDKGKGLPETGATLEGTVTYKGEKVYYAMVIAAGGQGGTGQANSYIDEGGRFKLENVPLGEVKLAVVTAAAQGQFMSSQQYTGPDKKGAKKASAKFISIPAPYDNPDTSGLTTTISKGKNEYNIVIK